MLSIIFVVLNFVGLPHAKTFNGFSQQFQDMQLPVPMATLFMYTRGRGFFPAMAGDFI